MVTRNYSPGPSNKEPVLFSPQITQKFRMNYEGQLEQMVSMATTMQPLTQHLHVTYEKVML